MHLKMVRDVDGRPVDTLHVHGHGHATAEDGAVLEKALWAAAGADSEPPAALGRVGANERSGPLAATQLLLLHHLLDPRRRSP